MELYTSVTDVVSIGPMFRTEVLPFLGVVETVKASQLSTTFNKVIDYNKHNQPSLPYLD